MRGPVADRTTDRSRRPALAAAGRRGRAGPDRAGRADPGVAAAADRGAAHPDRRGRAHRGRLPRGRADLDGRDATISGIDPADGQRADRRGAGRSPGSGSRPLPDARWPGRAGTTSPGSGTAPAPFGIARRGEDIVLSGVVGSPEERTRLLAAANLRAGGRAVVDELTVTPGRQRCRPGSARPRSRPRRPRWPARSGRTPRSASATNGISLTGTVADEAAQGRRRAGGRRGAAGTAAGQPAGLDPALRRRAHRPLPPRRSRRELDAAGKQQLQSSISQLLAGAPITFRPNSPQLTAAGPGDRGAGCSSWSAPPRRPAAGRRLRRHRPGQRPVDRPAAVRPAGRRGPGRAGRRRGAGGQHRRPRSR